MRSRISRWGNSLALRLPSAFAREIALGEGSEVELTLENGRVVITPVQKGGYSLGALLEGVRPDNLHGEVDTGAPRGSETW